MRIDYPTPAEREASISAILAEGLSPPPSLRRALADLYRALGLHGLLFGVGDCVLLAVLLSGCGTAALVLPLLHLGDPRAMLYLLSGCAPLLYAVLLLLTGWKEEQLGTRELKMTLRYDLRCLTAMRLFLFSGLGVLGNLLCAALAAAFWKSALLLVQFLALALLALFSYVSLTLACLLYAPARVQPFLPAAWAAACALPSVLLPGETVLTFLDSLPLAGTLLLALLAAWVSARLLRAYLAGAPAGTRPRRTGSLRG